MLPIKDCMFKVFPVSQRSSMDPANTPGKTDSTINASLND
jgi:hypothetical protein